MSLSLGVSESQLLEFAKSVKMTASKSLEGFHSSQKAGEGLEFHSSSSYTEGDEVRFIDWRRFASTDKFFIKKFERQEKISWSVLVDASESMKFGEKKDFVAKFVGSLVYVAQALGDQWRILPSELLTVEDAFRDLLEGKVGMDFVPEHLKSVPLSSSDRLVIVSDLFFDPQNLDGLVSEALQACREVVLVQILDSEEKDFGFSDVLEFEDMESPIKLLLDSRSVRKSYLQSLSSLQNEWRQRLKDGGRFIEVAIGRESISDFLRKFFEI